MHLRWIFDRVAKLCLIMTNLVINIQERIHADDPMPVLSTYISVFHATNKSILADPDLNRFPSLLSLRKSPIALLSYRPAGW